MRTARVRRETGLMRWLTVDGLRRYPRRVSCLGEDLKTLAPVVRVFVECVE